jgi:hypothetical protein
MKLTSIDILEKLDCMTNMVDIFPLASTLKHFLDNRYYNQLFKTLKSGRGHLRKNFGHRDQVKDAVALFIGALKV